jgi:hypothetical protein
MMTEKIAITPAIHRQLAVDLFNATWQLLDKADRSPDDINRMIHAAHASAYHWLQIGEPVNFARSHWQISRVYAVVNQPEPALFHARHSLDICLEEEIGDFDLAFAYEALARSNAVARNRSLAQKNIKLAQEAGQQIKEKDDRQYFFDQLATVPGYSQLKE